MDHRRIVKRQQAKGVDRIKGNRITLKPDSGARPTDFHVALVIDGRHINLAKNYFLRLTRSDTIHVITK